MLHVKQIQSLADNGDSEKAHEALEQLLALGPKNTQALKIKANLYGHEGYFSEENATWERIAQIDSEDSDAAQFLIGKQIEEREHFYFTDEIPGGKRFLAYPKKLIHVSMIGLAGCLAFLVLTQWTHLASESTSPQITLALFGLLVLFPWIMIVFTFFKSLKWIAVTQQSLSVASRSKTFLWNWNEIDHVFLAHSYLSGVPQLSLVIIPRQTGTPTVEVDLTKDASSIRARSYLIREIARLYRHPIRVRRETLDFKNAKLKSY